MRQAVSIPPRTTNQPSRSFRSAGLFSFRGRREAHQPRKEKHYGKSNEWQSVQERRGRYPHSLGQKRKEMGQEHLPQSGGSIETARDQNDRLSISTTIIKYDESIAVVMSNIQPKQIFQNELSICYSQIFVYFHAA